MLNILKDSDAAVLFVSGQSNACAHEQFMSEEDKITKPLKNVFALDRNPNQNENIEEVVFTGFTTCGKNLGETQDHTYSFVYYFSKMWQDAIDGGMKLPNLYIVWISIGAQGIINGMWNKDKEWILKPGVLGEVDISLLPWTERINSLSMKYINESFKKPCAIGWHWIGSEQDILPVGYMHPEFSKRYDEHFDRILASIGQKCPVYLYKILMEKSHNIPPEVDGLKGISAVNSEFLRLSSTRDDFFIVDIESECPFFDREKDNFGIFADDNVHYLSITQKWFAERFYKEIFGN